MFNICNNSNTLMVFLIIKYAINITCILVPLILIYRSIVPCFKSVMSGEPITKELAGLVKSFIAGFIVFILPSIFSFVLSLIPFDQSAISTCFTNASLSKIQSLRIQEKEQLRLEREQKKKEDEENFKKGQEKDDKKREQIKKQIEEAEKKRQQNPLPEDSTFNGTGVWADSIFPLPHGSSTCRSSVFGPRTHPITGEYDNHSGDDYPAICGTSVYAVLDGKVTAAANDGGYHDGMGNYVRIQHSDGTISVYMHSSNVLVKTGEHVSKGQEIMKVGTTGSSTGCHLHITIKNPSGTNVAPSNYIPTLPSCY